MFTPSVTDSRSLYLQLSDHYLWAIQSGALTPGDRMPSVRRLALLHKVSVSTTLQAFRHLENEGWIEARARSGYFVRKPRRDTIQPISKPDSRRTFDPAQYVGIHDRVSDFIAKCDLYPVTTNLAAAFASPDAYPVEALKNSAIRALRRNPEVLVSPVPPQGDPSFRTVLARRALAAGMSPSPDEIIVTHGCTEALNLALRAVAQPGDLIAVESPTYYGLLQALESLGMRTIEIPTNPQKGISIEALELALQTHGAIKAVVVVPNFQNPLGSVIPDPDKSRLVALCERQQVPLIEDDTYSALTDDDLPLKAVKAWDRTGNVIHCTSLHKTLAPGMRLGWMIGGRWHARIKMLKHAQSRPNDALTQIAAAEFMNSTAYDRHLRRLRRTLKTQRERIAEAITACFPFGTRLSIPSGGILLWVELPEQQSSRVVFDAALQQGIRVAPGLMFSNSNRFDHFIRISCGVPFSQQLHQALRELARIVSAAA